MTTSISQTTLAVWLERWKDAARPSESLRPAALISAPFFFISFLAVSPLHCMPQTTPTSRPTAHDNCVVATSDDIDHDTQG